MRRRTAPGGACGCRGGRQGYASQAQPIGGRDGLGVHARDLARWGLARAGLADVPGNRTESSQARRVECQGRMSGCQVSVEALASTKQRVRLQFASWVGQAADRLVMREGT